MAWVDELIHKCPVCGEQPKLEIDALTKEGFELYDRHFINDDTLEIKIVKE